MRIQLASPYYNLAMIRNEDMFFGRKVQLRRLYSSLVNRQSVSVLGKRRIGKSSFLWCSSRQAVQQRFSFDLSHHIFIFLDLHDYLEKTSDDFFHSVCKAMKAECERVAGLSLQHEESANARDAFSTMLDQIVTQGFFPVLLLDSFDKVTQNEHFSPAFFGFLRSQASRGRVSYVTASIAPLREVCHRSVVDSPFFNIFLPNRLEAFTVEDAFELITIPSQRAGMPFTESEIQWIQTLAGRHPFFLQRVCDILFDEKSQSDDETPALDVEQTELRRLQQQAYKDLLSQFEDMWEELTEEEQALLRQEARLHEHEKRKLPDLSESSLFRQFVRRLNQVDFHFMSVDELEDILKLMNEPDELENLGSTKIGSMHIVTRSLKKDGPVSSGERGMAIRAVLRDAFERMKMPSPRRDAAPEWRYYNILYYRYFIKDKLYHLNNEQLTARLNLGSTRQFYRERTKAIETLLNTLLEMERLANSQA